MAAQNLAIDARKKLVLVGDGGSGKTSLLMVRTQQYFPEKYIPTVFENHTTIVEYKKKSILLSLWDTAGQADYDRLRPLSYPETDVVMILFAVSEPVQLHHVIDKWSPEVQHFCPGIPVLLVGNKTDLRDDPATIEALAKNGEAPVTTAQGLKMAERIKAKYFETCCKTNSGIDEVFEAVAKYACKPRSNRHEVNCKLL